MTTAPSVLVVDDHPGFRGAAALVVETSERFVLAGTVVSGEDALAFVAEHDVDLILLDLHLGGADALDGVATAQAYAAVGGDATVVLMSTTSRRDLPAAALDPAAIHAFLPKEEFSLRRLDELWHDAGRSIQ